jgi:transaldolase
MPSKLEQLKQMTIVVADTGDLDAIKALSPVDCTTNPSLILKAAKLAGSEAVIDEALDWATLRASNNGARAALAAKRLTVLFGARASKLVKGRVSTEVDARLSIDTVATIAEAREMIASYTELGVRRERILVKIAATWEGIAAARVLEAEGIQCNLTLIFSLVQAHAAADASAYLISPFVGRITDWHKAQLKPGETLQSDPGVDFVLDVYRELKARGSATIIMGASFRTTDQIEALAGCDRLTIAPDLLEQLSATQGVLAQKLKPPVAATEEPTPLSETAFRLALQSNAMATSKLHDGIKAFVDDTISLEKLLFELLEQRWADQS